MELVLTSPDACNADYLDPRTMKPLFRVTTLSKKKSSFNAETTVVQAFQLAGQQQQQQQQQIPVQYHTSHGHPYQQQPSGHQKHTHNGPHGGYAASPYGAPPAAGYPASPQPGPVPNFFPMPQAYHSPPVQPSHHHQPPSHPSQPSHSTVQPVTTCQIEWHMLTDTLFHWPDTRGKVAADRAINSSGFKQRKRRFAARTGRTYVWCEDGSLQSATNAPLGSFVTDQARLQTRWEAQPVSALRWSAYLSIEHGVPMEDVADVIAVLAYSQKKTKNNEEIAKAIGEAGGVIGDAGGALG